MQKTAYEQLYGKFDDSSLSQGLYGTDFEKSLSSNGDKKPFGAAQTSKLSEDDGLPPKILHTESSGAATEATPKPLDIAEKENKFLKDKAKSEAAKLDAAKKLELLKGKGMGDIRPLDPPKKVPAPQPAERLEDSYEAHKEKLFQSDIEKGREYNVVEQQDDLFAPFVNYRAESEQVSFEDGNVIDRVEFGKPDMYEPPVLNTPLQSDTEIDSLLSSMSSLLYDTQKVLEPDEEYDDEPSQHEPEQVKVKWDAPPRQLPPVEKPKPVHRHGKYVRPTLDLLDKPPLENLSYSEDYDKIADQIVNVLAEFKIDARAVGYVSGPSVTLYEFELARGVSVKKILPLADDIAMRVSSKGGTVRIQAPILGKDLFGIEVPNKKTKTVYLRSVLESQEFAHAKGALAFALGPNIQGENIIPDLSDMPHLLIGGATGFGKSVCLNCLIVSLMYRCSPEELRFIFIDPKQVELTMYNGLPHMLMPEVVTDPEKAIKTFDWLVNEMERRFTLFKEMKVGDITAYNARIDLETTQKLPRIVLVVDELANLMTYNKNEIENKILRLSQKARAAGIHLVLATQRPSKEVITGDIKVNLPCRIALKVTTVNDSRTIFSQGGPEKLAGKGDMLFLTGALPEPVRLQGAFISKDEVEKVVNFIKERNEAYFDEDVANEILKDKIAKDDLAEDGDELDPFFWDVLKYCIEKKQASISMVQRRFKMGYNRAGKIVVEMERRKFISEQTDAKPRQVFISMEEYDELFED